MVEAAATPAQREYLVALSTKLGQFLSLGDPTAARIAREATLHEMDRDYADNLIRITEDAIRAFETKKVAVGPWGEEYYS